MALLDIFKKKKKKVEKEAKKVPEVKVEKKKPKPKPRARPAERKKISKVAYRVLKEPHVTEKATDLAGEGQYVFKVYQGANKNEVKKAIEGLYNVEVRDVKVIRVPPKKRRLGRLEGWRKAYKKAVIKLKQGQKIEVLPR